MNNERDISAPTHKVSFYGIRCFFNCETGDLWGVNRLCDYFIPVVAGIHNCLAGLLPGAGRGGFPLKVIEEY